MATKDLADVLMQFSFPDFKHISGGEEVGVKESKKPTGFEAADMGVVQQNHQREALGAPAHK